MSAAVTSASASATVGAIRLLKQAGDSSQPMHCNAWHMQLIGSGQNDAVGSRLLNKSQRAGKKRYSGGAGRVRQLAVTSRRRQSVRPLCLA